MPDEGHDWEPMGSNRKPIYRLARAPFFSTFRTKMLTDWLANREIHKPSAVVSFGLPGPLSLPAHADVWWLTMGTNLDREGVRVRLAQTCA